ncbi:AtpZ/AtpI family protein [Palleronia sp.]|uniref:AtpZ/AtpI family protein n=1 Tax=Palleronia sp. TaxID=1940284 RepID=UPI0035C7A367
MSEGANGRRDRIDEDARRKMSARASPGPSPLRGFGYFGMIGWAVAVPTVGGALIGLWLDRNWPDGFSWTLALLLGGLVVGMFIAWGWIEKERKE